MPDEGNTIAVRARDYGLNFDGIPDQHNAITDVEGVEVGFCTIVEDQPNVLRTGVTSILPRSRDELLNPVWAGQFGINGNGEMTGAHWINEAGWFAGPIAITNTYGVGRAHHAIARWMVERFRDRLDDGDTFILPVAAETYDGWLSDILAFGVQEEHVMTAINNARRGPVAEGSIGGGTGMVCYEFKGGTGTSSRLVGVGGETFTIAALVQANHGIRPWFKVNGVSVGETLTEGRFTEKERGSIVVVLATDAPLTGQQMQRISKRASIGIGRGGTPSGNDSGDIFLAFSTANNIGPLPEAARYSLECLGNNELDPLFMGAVQATEEAVINAIVGADTMIGYKGRKVLGFDAAAASALVARNTKQYTVEED